MTKRLGIDRAILVVLPVPAGDTRRDGGRRPSVDVCAAPGPPR
ncbi:hypothetical protein [Bifidobacterium sp. CP2]|nr:hypothetical protein [Bifidobacterium sp. CP2]